MAIYLDNAASSCPKPPGVAEAVNESLTRLCANPGRGAHKVAVAAARSIFEARGAVADFLGVDDSADIIFTQNATDAINMAMHGLLENGDHVVSSTVEHNAVARPLLTLAQERDVDVTLIPPGADGAIDPEAIVAALRPRTRLVALTHASNVTAAIQPVAEIGSELRKKGVPLLVDAAQSAGVLELDMGELPVDMLACTGHKSLMGPQGIGLLYLAPGIELRSVRQGGTGSRSEAGQDELDRPDRYEAGTLNAPGIAGLRAGIGYIRERGLKEIAAHKDSLTARLMAGLVSIAGVTVYGPPHGQPRAPLVTFNIGDMASTTVAATLDQEYDIASRAGLHCAPGAHRFLGTLEQGVVRLSVGPFNTVDEIDEAIGAVAAIAGRRPGER
ncbi:MAG: aminotransferase class V-fold PLP-dependent enzyme [Gaiellales bacterium]|nr:MAG: aminotransferase class V-fold PLP-dependent enzyme [Gaiellales bacterium]